ncbi:MAG: hypothetical protein AAF402_08050 [Pseudomonadota bacterium]
MRKNKNHSESSFSDGGRARRGALAKLTLLTGISAVSIPSVWKHPVVDSVLLPAHAAASVCPPLAFISPTATPGSGLTCPIAFEIVSSSAEIPVNILSITATPLGPNDGVTYNPESFPATATSESGVQVNWDGEAVQPIFSCTEPLVDTQFVVIYNCEVNDTEVSQTIALSAVVAAAPAVP